MKTCTADEARAIDRRAIDELGMPGILLMENASRGVAEHARRLGDRYLIVCGPGNNGGDGLAAARHLGPGARVVLLGRPDEDRSPDAALQLRILQRAGVPIADELPSEIGDETVVIDALFGTGLRRPIEGRAAEWIDRMNRARGPKLAVDIPSGLDADRGVPLGRYVFRAEHTVTFECAKVGLVQPGAQTFVGEVSVVPLGLPVSGSSETAAD